MFQLWKFGRDDDGRGGRFNLYSLGICFAQKKYTHSFNTEKLKNKAFFKINNFFFLLQENIQKLNNECNRISFYREPTLQINLRSYIYEKCSTLFVC